MITRRRLVAVGAASLALATGRPARANTLINLLAGAPAGSAPDVQACSFAPFLERHLPGTEIGVRDVVGEAGLAACRALADAPPDGALLGWVATPSLPARMVDRGGGALMERLTLLGAVQQEPIVLVAPPGPPPVLLELLDSIAAGDGAVALGTPPAGSAGHLAALRLQALLAQSSGGEKLSLFAFPSEPAARQAVIAGTVAAALLPQGAMLAALHDGRLQGVALAAAERSQALPDLPVFSELGVDFVSLLRRGLAAPSGLSPDAIGRLTAALQGVVLDPEFQDQGLADGFEGVFLSGGDWMEDFVAERAALESLWAAGPWLIPGHG